MCNISGMVWLFGFLARRNNPCIFIGLVWVFFCVLASYCSYCLCILIVVLRIFCFLCICDRFPIKGFYLLITLFCVSNVVDFWFHPEHFMHGTILYKLQSEFFPIAVTYFFLHGYMFTMGIFVQLLSCTFWHAVTL